MSHPRRRAGRKARGFTVVEILVGLAIVGIMAGILVPALLGRVRDSRRSALSQTLFALSQGIAEYRKAVTRYPSHLTLLTTQPELGVSTDACGNLLNAASINNWRGPYVSREILPAGIPLGDGLIENALTRETVGTSTYLLMNVTSVDRQIATDLEADLDGTPEDSTGGTVRFAATTPALVTLSYSIPIAGC